MSLARFYLVLSCDSAYGVSKKGEMPWIDLDDGKFFRELTLTHVDGRKNSVILGRQSYEDIPANHRPLKDRTNIVVSRTWAQQDHYDVKVVCSFIDALACVPATSGKVFVCGGLSMYKEALRAMYLCDGIYVTKYRMDYRCDEFLPQVFAYPVSRELSKTNQCTRLLIEPSETHPECSYLKLLSELMEEGIPSSKGSFLLSKVLSFSLYGDTAFFLTTRRTVPADIISVVNALMEALGVHDAAEAIKDTGSYPVVVHCSVDNTRNPLIDSIRLHFVLQQGSKLSLMMDVLDVDVYDQLPVLISALWIMMKVVCRCCGLVPHRLEIMMGMCHLAREEQVHAAVMLRRTPKPLARIRISDALQSLRPLTDGDVDVVEYTAWHAF